MSYMPLQQQRTSALSYVIGSDENLFYWTRKVGKGHKCAYEIFSNLDRKWQYTTRFQVVYFSFFIFGWHQSFMWGHRWLLVTSALGFNARVDPSLAYFVTCMQWIPQNSPLVGHLLTSWWQTWQLSFFDLCTGTDMYKHWWDSNLGSCVPQCDRCTTVWAMLARLSSCF